MRGWRFRQPMRNGRQHIISFQQYFIVPETKYAESNLFKCLCALYVVNMRIQMLTTVEFDNQSPLDADEIDDVASKLMLAPKFHA